MRPGDERGDGGPRFSSTGDRGRRGLPAGARRRGPDAVTCLQVHRLARLRDEQPGWPSCRATRTGSASRCGRRRRIPRRQASRRPGAAAVKGFRSAMESLLATASDSTVAALQGHHPAHRLPRGTRRGADDRSARADREPRGARRRRASTTARRRSRRSPGSCRRSRCTPTRMRSAANEDGSGRPGHAADVCTTRRGRVLRRGLHARARGGDLPARPLARGNSLEEERRLCYVGMTRAKERLTLTSTRCVATSSGQRSEPAVAVPSSTSCRGSASNAERLRPAAWSDYGRAEQHEFVPREVLPDIATGDVVRHASLGSGIVLADRGRRRRDDVRFEDWNERRLMFHYAPLEKIG